MTKKLPKEELNPICLDCRQQCKQKAVVKLLNCSRYHRKARQLELKFSFEKTKGKKK